MDYDGFVTLIDGIGTGEKNTALEVRTLLKHFLQSIYLPGDVKHVYCTAEDLVNDYTSTGLGIGKRQGWAKCNGLNGTIPVESRVIVGHSDEYPTIGAIGGAKTHTLTLEEIPEHEHFNGISDDIDDAFVYGATTAGLPGLATTDIDTGGSSRTYQGKTSKAGGNMAHNNMQPYVVLLAIQKL